MVRRGREIRMLQENFAAFLIGKTITGVRMPDGDHIDGFDLIFSDGTELEVYTEPTIAWVQLAAEEARHAAESGIPDWPTYNREDLFPNGK
jgi:hypothetical protein